MSHTDRVVDYMAGLPQMAEHGHTYATEFAERLAQGDCKVIDGVEEEKKMVSLGEREILQRLQCQVKFTRENFVGGWNLKVSVQTAAKEFVKRDSQVQLDFLGSRRWFLDAAMSDALYSSKESVSHVLDEAQRKKILAMCPLLSGDEANDIHTLSVHERISIPQDLRHIMLKMYLILQDYNLAVTSKSTEMSSVVDLTPQVQENARAIDRISAVTRHRVVVDTSRFTGSELGLLALAGEQYPSVWYTHDNMYTKCNMAPDDILFISEGRVAMDTSFQWGSPDRLYQQIWTIAAKLGAIPCLISAFEMMRGKCKMMADVVKRVGECSVNSMIPLSYNMVTAFGELNDKYSVTNMPGYFSSSMSLVSDLLYGSCFEAVASCVGESLGGCGTLLSSATPADAVIFNGILRDYGLKHPSAADNVLLQNWDILSGRPMTWSFGIMLRDYVVNLCGEIVNGVDILLPQLLQTIPGLRAVHTAYGLSRGWRGPSGPLSSKKARADDNDGLAAFSWMMGCRALRPRVFFNKSGRKELLLGPDDHELGAEMEKGFGIGRVSFWIADSVGGRIDENEDVTTSFYRTEYAGTRSSFIYSYSENRWVEHAKVPPPGRQSMKGIVPAEAMLKEAEGHSKVKIAPLEGINWGASRKRNNDAIFDKLGTLSRSNQIVPSKQPRHAKVNSQGLATVPTYTREGAEETTLVKDERREFNEGDKIEYSVINVPGDGECGLHALTEDLKIHGMLSGWDAQKARELFSQETISKTFHDAQELAAAAVQWGMNLDVFDKGTNRLMRYGQHKDGHTITIMRDGNHFTPITPGGPNSIEIKHIDDGQMPNEELVKNVIGQFGNLFGSPTP